MKRYFKLFIIMILVIALISNIKVAYGIKITNQEKFFLRLSEKYDKELFDSWGDAILDKKEILDKIKKINGQEKYSEYLSEFKKSKIYRIKNKYIRKLNHSVKKEDEEKIKRYLKLILNIFCEENKMIIEYFDLD